jgi:hypothetical protein
MPQIIPIAGPPNVQSGTAPSASQLDARARAIAKLTGGDTQLNIQSHPVPNPSSISPEEMGAATSQVQKAEVPQTEGQTPNTDVQQTSNEATAPKKAPLSSQYAQLARKEKQIRDAANAVKAREAAMQAREDAIKAKEAEMQAQYVPKDRIAKDPLKVLQEQGYTSDQITQMLLNAPDPAQQAQQAVIEELRAEIRALKDGQESAKKTFEETQTQQYTQAVNQIRNEIKQLVSTDESFETIRATRSQEDVVELITKTFEKEGVLLTVEEAAQAVEEYLEEEAVRLASLKKIQAKMRPKAATAPTSQQKPAEKQTQPKTLTSNMGTARSLTAKERAILAFKGELK